MTAAVVTRLVAEPTSVPRQRREALRPVPMASFQASLPLGMNEPRPPERDRFLLDLQSFSRVFAKVLVDVLNGDRGVQQLLRWTSEPIYADLLRRTAALRRAGREDQRIHRLRSHVASVHVCSPRPGVGEVSVHVRHGQRSRALCFRVQREGDRWQCVILEFG